MKQWWKTVFRKAKSFHLPFLGKKPERTLKAKKGRLYLGEILILLVLGYLTISFWPLREFLVNGFLNGRTLIVFTNESEARPCGGFVTAVGEVGIFPPTLKFMNAYSVQPDLGVAPFPLDRVSPTMNFWDLGTTADLAQCSENFKRAYEAFRGKSIRHVVLFDTKTLEDVFVLFGDMKLEGQDIHAKTLFSALSRLVADVDRHSEEALAERKTPLSRLGKKMVWRALFNPLIFPQMTRIVEKNFQSGQLYFPEISPQIRPLENDFVITEWNLGGGKSSRFLQKTVNVIAREVAPNDWGIFLELTAQHLGGTDEPLSQTWKGFFEVRAPQFLDVEPFFAEAEIEPGRAFRKQFLFNYEGTLSEFSVFCPRGQELFANVSISLFPQKTFANTSFPTHENVGHFLGKVSTPRKTFSWSEIPDTTPPFITLHEVISVDQLSVDQRAKWEDLWKDPSKSFLTVEVHFNEMIRRTEEFSAILEDLNMGSKSRKENPELVTADLLSNNTTLLLGFTQTQQQDQERFALEISGLEDFSGNQIIPVKRTVIDRRISVP